MELFFFHDIPLVCFVVQIVSTIQLAQFFLLSVAVWTLLVP